MRISEALRILLLIAVPTLFALTRCAPHEPCVRISDCEDGQTCSRGRCVWEEPSASSDGDASSSTDGSVAKPNDASTSADTSTTTPVDASVADASVMDADASDSAMADAPAD